MKIKKNIWRYTHKYKNLLSFQYRFVYTHLRENLDTVRMTLEKISYYSFNNVS